MKWLIIGTGWISEDYVEALKRNNEEPWYILSRDKKRAKDFAERNNIPYSTTSYKKALTQVDAVYIATPNATHYEYAKKAIKNGKHVMIEKPMTHSLKLTKELFKLGEKFNVKVMEAYVHITSPEFRKLQGKGKHLQANLEKISSKIKAHTYKTASSFSKKLFGGVLPDLGVYPISLAVFMYGKVKKAHIENITYLNKVEVECDVKLEHKDGQVTVFSLSKLEDGDNDVRIDGKKVNRHTAGNYLKHRMDNEIALFVSDADLSEYKDVSIETARIIEELKKVVNKNRD